VGNVLFTTFFNIYYCYGELFEKFQVLREKKCGKDGVGTIVPEYDHNTEDFREEENVLKDLDNVIDNAKLGLKICESNPF